MPPAAVATTAPGGATTWGLAPLALVDDRPPTLAKRTVLGIVLRRGGPKVLEASIVPAVLFLSCLTWGSLGLAYVSALAWTYGCLLRRLLAGDRVSGVLVLASVGVTVRTALAVASGSSFVYFLQPIIGTVVTGAVFLGSLAVGRPLIAKLAHDFWPITPDQAANPRVVGLMRGLTVLWAGVNLATATTTFVLLSTLPMATFVAAKQATGLAITCTAIAVTIAWSHRVAVAEGVLAR